MRILHLISSGGMYGAEAVILNLSRTLNEQSHTSVIGIFSNSSNPNLQLHERALAEGIESHPIPCNGQLDRSVLATIRSLVATTAADVIHAHGYKADVYAYLALRNSNTPLISTCHNWLDDTRLAQIYGKIDRFALRRYAAVIAVSDEVRQRLLASGVRPDRVHFIRNGIDFRPFTNATPSLRHLAIQPDGLLVGWVGRLSREKGPDLFLRAVKQVHAEFANTRFVLVGEGPDRIALEHLIKELGIGDVVQLEGRRTDMPSVYASFDMMVSSSRREGLPMAVLEGMASGLPWVATAVGDVPTVIRDDQTGALVYPENVEVLANSMATMMRSPKERARMGSMARHLTQLEFSAQRMSGDYVRVYTSLVRQTRDTEVVR